MKILLGIFNAGFYEFAKQNEDTIDTYPFERVTGYELEDEIIDQVIKACQLSSGILFRIDGIKPNVQRGLNMSVTCRELVALLSDKSIDQEKIVFMINNEVISHKEVFDRLDLSLLEL